MRLKLPTILLGGIALAGQMYAQEVMIMREDRPKIAPPEVSAPPQLETSPQDNVASTQSAKPPEPAKEHTQPPSANPEIRKAEIVPRPTVAPVQKPAPPVIASAPIKKPAEAAARAHVAQFQKPAQPVQTSAPAPKLEAPPRVVTTSVQKVAPLQTQKPEPAPRLPSVEAKPISTALVSAPISRPEAPAQLRSQEPASTFVSAKAETAFIKLANGFDFPIGRPDAQGYYKARGFRAGGHVGEDWDGVGGGDTDQGDPVYSIGDGVVVFARDVHMGWGNVVIVRHAFREGGSVKSIDALYGHLEKISVRRGQSVARGQLVGTIGTAHGIYDAHLHLEIRKNLEIGMSRAAFARDFTNYYDPTQFINSHRQLQTSTTKYRVAMNTFTRDSRINFDKARNNRRSHVRGTSQSAAALKKAIAVQNP